MEFWSNTFKTISIKKVDKVLQRETKIIPEIRDHSYSQLQFNPEFSSPLYIRLAIYKEDFADN